ncbi:MAG: imidazolonepropionase, partial [Fimbriimonadaceae bacterium]|nr:imidazolonepropionase [Alphaproteobacteria bacterium]
MRQDKQWDSLWLADNIATMVADPGSGQAIGYGLLDVGAIAVKDGRIAWIGPVSVLDGEPDELADAVRDLSNRLITPALIDCHTHLVYGGSRAREFELRLEGATYEEIARAGGGIVSTVKATRAASEDDLYAAASPRITRLMRDGVGVVEIKSGYGLNLETEMKMLRVARKLGQDLPVQVRTTFLGAHALPPEFTGDSAGYIELICDEMIPAIAESGLADAVDGFCEGIGFSRAEMEQVFEAARHHGLPVKLHAEQLSNLHGAALAASYHALSADHLEYLDGDGIAAMKEAGTVAVLLPGAFYFLRETKLPPIDDLRRAGVPIALASDANPGSSPITSLLLILNMACTLFRMTPVEALAGVTRHAATALGLGEDYGTLE